MSTVIEKNNVNITFRQSPESFPQVTFLFEKVQKLLYTEKRKRTFVRLQKQKGEIKI